MKFSIKSYLNKHLAPKTVEQKSVYFDMVFYSENNFLIAKTSDLKYRIIDYYPLQKKHKSLPKEGYLNFNYNKEFIEWKNQSSLTIHQFIEISEIVDYRRIHSEGIEIGSKNNAPTKKHSTHHYYLVYLNPFSHTPISVGESIHGGHGESGGGASYSFIDLLKLENWKDYFIKSESEWAITIIENTYFTSDEKISLIMHELKKYRKEKLTYKGLKD